MRTRGGCYPPFFMFHTTMIIIMVIVASLGEEVRDRRTAILAGLVGGCGLGFLALAMAAPLYRYFPRVVEYDIPMLYVARQAAPVMWWALTCWPCGRPC